MVDNLKARLSAARAVTGAHFHFFVPCSLFFVFATW